MRIAFADASFLLPSALDEPDLRQQALAVLARHPGTELVTSDGVLSEMLARVARKGPKARSGVAALVRRILSSEGEFTVVSTTPRRFDRGLALYEARLDQRYSHVDCVSMAIMDELGIEHVLTFDRDFHGEGRYIVLPQRS